MIRTAALGCALLALTLFGLSLHTPGAGTVGSPEAKVTLVVVLAASGIVYLLSAALSVRRPAGGRAVWLVLAFAVAMRLPLIPATPFLSSDVYRYVWDGRVQAAGINPYRYLPADPALTSLRDAAVWPHINRADYAPTIYPPMAQVVFAAIGRVWPTVIGEKVVMFGFECLTAGCLLALLRAAGLPAERVLIYAWNPLPVWAFAGNGHIDAAVCALVAIALLLRVRRWDGWTGVALGAATLTKFLPVVIAPVLWRQGSALFKRRSDDGRSGSGHDGGNGDGGAVPWWRMPATALATVVGLYACYLSVGWKVFGFLTGYGTEEGLSNGSGIWLLAALERLFPLPRIAAPLYLAVLTIILLMLGIRYAFTHPPRGPAEICAAAGTLMAVVTFGISPHYPWYFAWLAVPCVLAPGPAVLWLATAPVLIYLDTYGDRFAWPSLVFAPAVVLALPHLTKRIRECQRQP